MEKYIIDRIALLKEEKIKQVHFQILTENLIDSIEAEGYQLTNKLTVFADNTTENEYEYIEFPSKILYNYITNFFSQSITLIQNIENYIVSSSVSYDEISKLNSTQIIGLLKNKNADKLPIT